MRELLVAAIIFLFVLALPLAIYFAGVSDTERKYLNKLNCKSAGEVLICQKP